MRRKAKQEEQEEKSEVEDKSLLSPYLSQEEIRKIKRNMRSKNQVFIFNDVELSLIKAVFADNDDLLYLIRNVLLQFPLTAEEMKMLRSAMTPEVISVLRKRILPEVSPDAPFSQLSDLYQTLNNDLNTKSSGEMELLFEAKQLEIDYLTQQFLVLEGKDVEQKIILDDLKDLRSDNAYVNTKARNFILAYVDQMLILVKNIAGEKKETVEEAKKRMQRDSTK